MDESPGELMDPERGPLHIADLPDDPRPLLLIDVDGVLNVLSYNRNPKPRVYDDHIVRTTDGYEYEIRFRKELPEWLFALSQHFVPVWCTMWDHEANLLLAPLLGLPDLPVIPCHENGMNSIFREPSLLHHKVPVIIEHVPGRTFAWIDDEISHVDQGWAAQRDNLVAPTKLLKINGRMGLLEHHVNKLIDWSKKIS